MSDAVLNIFDAGEHVAEVRFDGLNDQFHLNYTAVWRQMTGAYPLSPHLPLHTASEISSPSIRRFIENLLPEGRALDIVSVTYQVAKNNVYGLIAQIGQETTGALSFLPAGMTPDQVETSTREISLSELAEKIRLREEVPFAVWDGKVRMSIAGYQDKLAVYVSQDRLFLVEGRIASTHILKPESADRRLPFLVANEHYCMRLAKPLGLRVAAASILRTPDPVLMVERFDRKTIGGDVHKRHIIDACQALDLPVSYKYERNFGTGEHVRNIRDGVSFQKLFSTSEFIVDRAVALQQMVRWALFNFLIGNADAHGKNVSFYSEHAGLTIAPFYDLVSVVQYPTVDHELAMAYGDEFLLDAIKPFDWADFAARTGVKRAFLAREMKLMAGLAKQIAGALAHQGDYVGDEQGMVNSIVQTVMIQADKLFAMADPMKQVSADLL